MRTFTDMVQFAPQPTGFLCIPACGHADATGPVFPYGFEMGFFAVESEAAKLSDPGGCRAFGRLRCGGLDAYSIGHGYLSLLGWTHQTGCGI